MLYFTPKKLRSTETVTAEHYNMLVDELIRRRLTVKGKGVTSRSGVEGSSITIKQQKATTTQATDLRVNTYFKLNTDGDIVVARKLSNVSQILDGWVDDDGNIYGVTNGASGVPGTTDVGTVWKWNSSGALQWNYLHQRASMFTTQRAIHVDSSGNVHVAGQQTRNNAGVFQNVLKLNSSGALQYDYDTGGHIEAIWVDAAGDVYVCQQSPGVDEDANNNEVRRLSSTLVNELSFDASGSGPESIVADSSGNIFVGEDNAVRKYNSSGVLQDTYSHNGGDTDRLYYDGTYIYAGSSSFGTDEDAGVGTIWKLSTATPMVKQWAYNTFDDIRGIATDTSDNVYVCGLPTVISGTFGNIWKFNSAGALQWGAMTYNREPNDDVTGAAISIRVDSSDNIHVFKS